MKKLHIWTLLIGFGAMYGQTGIFVPEMTSCDAQVQQFMTQFNIPSVTMALTKNGKLKYMRTFGVANISGTEAAQPYHMYRLASVSKPITSIGIMKMMEDGDLSLSDKVFGTGGLLENHHYFQNTNFTDTRFEDITVQMLLEHSAGFNRDIDCYPNPTSPYPWFFGGCDPITAPLHVTQVQGESNPATEEVLINFLLEKDLNFDPGDAYSYSNIGYLLLSEIIEEKSGMSYEAWMQEEIFNPLGIYDMHIGKDRLENKMEREVEYVGTSGTTLDISGNGNTVPWEYGGMVVSAMDGHGGWIASARDMVRLLVAVDGFNTKPDILNSTTINTMVEPSSNNPAYAKGWSVNSSNNWWHNGAIPGTAAMWVRSSNGYTWNIIMNGQYTGSNTSGFWSAIDGMGWNCISTTTNWPAHDFLEAPTINAHNLIKTASGASNMSVSWENGNGNGRIVVAKDITNSTATYNFSTYPIDGTDYSGNAAFGSGENLGDNTFVVYNGTGNNVNITNLDDTKTYAIRVYEFIKNGTNGNNALYLLGNPADMEAVLSTNENILSRLKIYPNPTSDILTVELPTADEATYVLYDIQGRMIFGGTLTKNLDLNTLSSGIYMLRVSQRGQSKTMKVIKK